MNCSHFDALHETSVTGSAHAAATADGSDTSTAAGADAMGTHLAECPSCRVRLQNYVITTQVLRALGPVEAAAPTPPLAESQVQRILAAIRVAKASGQRGAATA